MNMHVPWKMRLKTGPQSNPHDAHFWVRRKFRDELDVTKRSNYQVEEDLDHLGAHHRHHH